MFKKAISILSLFMLVGLLISSGTVGAADTPPWAASPTHNPDYKPGEMPFRPATTQKYVPMAVQTPARLSWSQMTYQSYRDGNWDIYLSNDDGTGVRRMTSNTASDIYPRLNRGATRLTFASNRTGNYEIFVVNADGSAAQQLTTHTANDYNPAWSPDSSRILFNSYRDGQSEIYVMDANGANLTRLTFDSGYDGGASWSPDGSKIAFQSDRSGGRAIWVMNADGSVPTLLAAQPYAENPMWSPDGSQIAYDADGDGDGWQEVWMMNAAGNYQQQIYDPDLPNTDVWVRSWSPDGQYIAFTRISFIYYQGNWYWVHAYMDAYAPQTGTAIRLSGADVNWYPDWQTTDIAPPVSSFSPLSAESPAQIQVHWSGNDVGAAGMRNYDVQVKNADDTDWVNWKMQTIDTTGTYLGIGGHTYNFRVRARDNAHNVASWSVENEITTTVEALPPVSYIQPLPAYTHIDFPPLIMWNSYDPGNSGINHYDVQYRDAHHTTWTGWLTNTLYTAQNFWDGEAGHTYHFRVRAQDNAQNLENWSEATDNATTTFYTLMITGTVRDNTRTPLANALVS